MSDIYAKNHQNDPDNKPIRLKPCPFCGGAPHFGVVEGDPETNSDVGGEFIACRKCGVTTVLVFPLKESAKEKLTWFWNRRDAATAKKSALRCADLARRERMI